MEFLKASAAAVVTGCLLAFTVFAAYNIRLKAIVEYGLVIHEFDPWFNFRATQYLLDNGMAKFFKWFDYMSWYPLGRPVGSTIYPGMQLTSVSMFYIFEALGYPMSINDICCYVPAWFGVAASLVLGALTMECSGSKIAGAFAAAVMAIIPAHIMRSVGGGYDNESIAMTAMVTTFYFWARSIRDSSSWIFGIFTGLAYIYMVAAWGGFVFVLNMIGVHAAVTCLFFIIQGEKGHANMSNLHRAYSLFYIIGTAGAIQIPVVGWSPLKSLEQLAPGLVFIGIQIMEFCNYQQKKDGLSTKQLWLLRIKICSTVAVVGMVAVYLLAPTGYFGPLSSRVRGLFVKHTKTGNPLVDSVAEHQPASAAAYYQNLHIFYYIAPVGFVLHALKHVMKQDNPRGSASFLILWALVAYFFSSKMSRLIILLGPIASALGGVALGDISQWSCDQFLSLVTGESEPAEEKSADAQAKPTESSSKKKKGKKAKSSSSSDVLSQLKAASQAPETRMLRIVGAAAFLLAPFIYGPSFYQYCDEMAGHMSHPSIMFKGTLRDGTTVMVDDYRQAYWFLRDKTPQDARVMAWWDYGYQITGIGNRTSIADGNTWNHEHIATLARCLVSPEKKAHRMIKHLADYVLVWTGGGGDDLAKSIHIGRIGNSVYKGICSDALCSKFGMTRSGPTKMMAKSLIYKLHSGLQNPKFFKHVFTSQYGKVKIYQTQGVNQKSKKWVADPANRVCDAPGSWYCSGQYPPGLHYVLKKRKDFQQLENFNQKGDKDAEEYQKEYMKGFK
eukprot:CAMPEP_0175150518 /NCGR_PEP_ID=MMETSP0087-20121206/17938_1 /TAXON_ID=136419 /ORGANISM="Unknown Unknown, Strain D1" /LENGTH=781 /DNA_ID=CAMNT_0016436519 /DNA_START=27 /DNA_END=2372 /DNA_ORIENTATION=+